MSDDLRTRIEWALFDACCRFDVPDGERRDMADAVIAALTDEFVDFGAWLAEEITGRAMTRIDLESCFTEWSGGADRGSA